MTPQFALAALLAAAPLAAQDTAGARLVTLELFRPGETVRLHVRGVGHLRGAFVGLDSATLRLRDRRAVRNIPVSGIDSIWRHQNRRTNGTVAGLIAGGVLGGFLGAFFSPSACHCANPPSARYAVRGAVLGMSFGAVIGTVSGGVMTRWERWYP